MTASTPSERSAGLAALLAPHLGLVISLVALGVIGSGLNLVIPRLISYAIDHALRNGRVLRLVSMQCLVIAVLSCAVTYVQTVLQMYASERTARDLRSRLARTISIQSPSFIETISVAKLLTHFTADVDAVKIFISTAIPNLTSSLLLVGGASALLLVTSWRLALAILGIIPLLALTFYVALRNVRHLYAKGQEALDQLTQSITESILGAMLIRVLNARQLLCERFLAINGNTRDVGLAITRLIAAAIPIVIFAVSTANVVILALGGRFVIRGSLSLGEFTAFASYLAMLVSPIMTIGFTTSAIAKAKAAFQRLNEVLAAPLPCEAGHLNRELRGDIRADHVSVSFGETLVLHDISFLVRAGTRTAIVGPAGAGKSHLLHVLIGMLRPASGTILYDEHCIEEYQRHALHRQLGIVPQDSIIYNLSLRENIAFGSCVSEADLEKAVSAAELEDFVAQLPDGLDTVVSERGATLSGGQKQRVALARALALNPKILLLDDFAARVDRATEAAIARNIGDRYPGMTILSVTQRIASVEQYDQIVLLMEGRLLATGTHDELRRTSPEYVQLCNSQASISYREVHA